MKWLKTIKIQWLLLIIVCVQLGIWMPSFLKTKEEALRPNAENVIGPLSKKSKPKRIKTVLESAPKPVSRYAAQIKFLTKKIQESEDEEEIAVYQKMLDAMERAEISRLRRETKKRERMLAHELELAQKLEQEALEPLPEVEAKPALNTDQPTLLIYADWFLINWQAILSILTILPIVAVRWKNLLTGQPIETPTPE